MQPQYPQYPAQTYPQSQPQPQYAPPQYGPPQYYPPPPPPMPLVQGTLEDFFDAPSAGNKAWVFKDRPIGTRYAGIVARVVGKADIRQQTDSSGRPATYRDGRPKFVMVVPMLVAPSAEFPEGQSSWWVKGQARDELVRAMAEAGAPAGPPEAGATITVTLVGMRPIPGMNPAFQYRITYQRPTGAQPMPWDPTSAGVPVGAPAPNAVVAPATAGAPGVPTGYVSVAAPAVSSQPVQVQQPVQYAQPVVVAPQFVQPQPGPAPVAPPMVPQPAAAPASTAPPVMAPNTLTAEQQQLLAQLTGS